MSRPKHESIQLEPFNDQAEEHGVHYRGIAPLPAPLPAANPSRHTYLDPRGGSVYRVSLDYFDPSGVEELRRRSLTSNHAHDLRQALAAMPLPDVEESGRELVNMSSHATLVGQANSRGLSVKPNLKNVSSDSLDTLDSADIKEAPFDFEKSLQNFMQQYVSHYL